MNIEEHLTISFYKTIATIDEEHKIYLVQHVESKKIFIKKILTVYNLQIFQYIKEHPIKGIPRVYECIEDNNTLIIIEEYISGHTLEEILQQTGKLDENLTIHYTYELCNILKLLHNCQPAIIHRDIKPSNVIITPSNHIYLIDLNAAKHYANPKETDTILLGTQGYAAPEQYGFGSSSLQTDIYAIGVLMNTMLSGGYDSNNNGTGPLKDIIDKCTKLDAKDRYQTTRELQQALKPFILPDNANDDTQTINITPPGFRSKNPLHMLIAIIGYLFIIMLCSTLQIEGASPTATVLERFCYFIMLILLVLFNCNYLDMQKYFPLCKNKEIKKKCIGFVLGNAIIILLILLIMIIIQAIFTP